MQISSLPKSSNVVHALPKDENIAEELQNLLQQFRATENDPGAQLKILMKIKSFLEENKGLIEEQCAHNGWSQNSGDWQQHFDTFFNHALSLINADEFNPQIGPSHSFDPINEFLTQLDWLMSNKNG